MLRTRPSMQKMPCKHHPRSSGFICAAGPCAGVTSRIKGDLGRRSGSLWRKASIRGMINAWFGLDSTRQVLVLARIPAAVLSATQCHADIRSR